MNCWLRVFGRSKKKRQAGYVLLSQPQSPQLTEYQRFFGRSALPFRAALRHSTAWDTKLLHCRLMIRTNSNITWHRKTCAFRFSFINSFPTYAFFFPRSITFCGNQKEDGDGSYRKAYERALSPLCRCSSSVNVHLYYNESSMATFYYGVNPS